MYPTGTVIVEINEAKNYRSPPAIGVQLSDRQLVKLKDFNKERGHWESKTRLQLFLIYHDGILNRNLVVHVNIWLVSIELEDLSRDLVMVM